MKMRKKKKRRRYDMMINFAAAESEDRRNGDECDRATVIGDDLYCDCDCAYRCMTLGQHPVVLDQPTG